jgi:NADPH-dependent glutamate synthase beta subunit-like oxidoreductase
VSAEAEDTRTSGAAPPPGRAAAPDGALPGYAECHFCTVRAKRRSWRCRGCVGRLDLRERLIRSAEDAPRRRVARVLSLILPGAGHLYAAQPGTALFYVMIVGVALGYFFHLPEKGAMELNLGRYFVLAALAGVWALAALDAGRGHDDRQPPCQEACPAHLACMLYVQHVRERRHRASLEQVALACPLPASIGRVCHHPCEKECRRGRVGEAIAICALKRFVSDRDPGATRDLYRAAAPPAPLLRERIAVVGAGPSGLSAALALRIIGYPVTLLEAEAEPGGMPAVAIPDYRLPQEVYRREVDAMLAAGIELRTGRRLGKDFQLADLEAEGFAGAYLALGAQRTVRLPHCGTPEQGFVDGLEFLRAGKLGTAGRLSGDALVIGGGNVAMDVAKTALRLGATTVRVIFLETRETMPAHSWECEEALEEGIILIPAAATISFEHRDGRVAAALCRRVQRIELDENRRIRPVYWEGTDFTLAADTVITAVGSGPDYGFLSGPPPRTPLARGLFVGRLPAQPGVAIPVFYGGDYLSGPASVIQAIAAGYQAANALHGVLGKVRYLRLVPWNRMRRVRLTGYTDAPAWRGRVPVVREEPADRCTSFCEICHVYPDDGAVAEAGRCLRCRWKITKATAGPAPDIVLGAHKPGAKRVETTSA